MRAYKGIICFTGLILIFVLAEDECHAEFSLHPGIYMRLEATDNLYLSDVDRKRELIATIAPNVWLRQDGRLLNLELEYAYEIYRFLNEPSLNDRVDTHLGVLDGTILPERDLYIELYGDARLDNLDWRRSDIVDPATVNTTNRYLWRIRPTYHHDFGLRNSAEAAYAYEGVEYDNYLSDDTQSQRVELAFDRRHSTRLDLRLEGFYEQLTSRLNFDYERLQSMVGGEWRPFPKMTIAALAGKSWFEYETGETFNSRVYDCSLLYAPSQRWAVDASYLKTFINGVQDGLYRSWWGEGGVSYSGRLSWRLSLHTRVAEFVQINRDDREQGIVGEASYQLTSKVVLGAYGDNRFLEFEPLGEEVNRYSFGASVEYAPHNEAYFGHRQHYSASIEHDARDVFSMGCRYVYRNSDSNVDVNDYEENRFTCEIRLTYPLIP